jgi:hypothetical protein
LLKKGMSSSSPSNQKETTSLNSFKQLKTLRINTHSMVRKPRNMRDSAAA